LEAACREKAKILYLSNPDNPLGSYHEAATLADFIRAVPPETLIILDEAYCETAPDDTLLPFDIMPENLLRLRTFSKAYGLAGLRCGYVIGCPHAIAAFDKIRDHFAVNRLAQRAALVALEDQAYLVDVVGRIAQARARIATIARTHGFRALPSATNFVAIDCGRDGTFAVHLLSALEQEGVFIRKPSLPPLDKLIRVSAAPPFILGIFEESLASVLRRI